MMRTSTARLLILAGLACLLSAVLACNREPLPEVAAVTHPELGAVEDAVRQQIEDERDALQRARRRSGAVELASAYGRLGELYLAYGLTEPARASFANASQLDPASYVWPYLGAEAWRRDGDLEAAAKGFGDALAIRGDSDLIRLQLARSYLALGDLNTAGDHLGAIGDDSQLAAAAAYERARLAVAAEDDQAAVAQFERALELQPSAGIVRHGLSQALIRLGDEQRAAQVLAAGSVRGEPTVDDPLLERVDRLAIGSGAFLRRANAHLVAGRVQEAIDELHRGLELHPRHAELSINLAIAQRRAGDVDGAIATLAEMRDALAASGDSISDQARIVHDLGTAYMTKGLNDEAITAFERALELMPEYADAQFNLANALAAAERWPAVVKAADRAVELGAGDRRARYLAAIGRERSGDSAAAVEQLRQLVAEDPSDAPAAEGLAQALTKAGQRDQALEVYRAAYDNQAVPIEQRLQLLDAAARRAWSFNRRPLAIELWRRAVALAPDSTRTHTDLANALQLTGEQTEAVEEFAKAVELDPQNATAWLSEARLWILIGDYQAAKERLIAALEHHSDDVDLIHTLARLLATAPEGGVRDGRRGLLLARKAVGMQQSLEHAETVAMALAEIGQFEEAIRYQRGLARQAQIQNDQRSLTRLVQHLRKYEQRQPIRIERGEE